MKHPIRGLRALLRRIFGRDPSPPGRHEPRPRPPHAPRHTRPPNERWLFGDDDEDERKR